MKQSNEKVVYTTCASHCGGTCVLKCYVKAGVLTRIETDDGKEAQLRACAKGRAYRQRVYHPDRLLFPMKRVGKRGEGKFERITWDEALDTVAGELIRVRDTYGPASILYLWRAADMHQINNSNPFHKLLTLAGGYTGLWGIASFQGGISASEAQYGTRTTDNARDDLLNSRLIILWGWNPANTITGTNTSWYLAQAREAGSRVIAVDPRHTDTAAIFADEWIPIRPGTDAAMLIAMAYVMIDKNLQDRAFLDRYTIGFEKFKDSVLGLKDGEAKTPSWAEQITGVPASTIENLAVEYVTTKPAALMTGIAPGRTAYGEQYHRAAMTLAAMTGNVGIHGGSAGARAWESSQWYPFKMKFPRSRTSKGVHKADLPDFILKGKAGGYPADPKLAVILNTNYANQDLNTNKVVQGLMALEFIVVQEQFMTATAKFADILFPTTTFLERNDIDQGVGTAFYGYVNKVIEPLGECKSHLEIARELAVRMGIADFGDESEDELLRQEVAGTEIPDYEEFKTKGIYRIKLDEPYVAFKKQIEDPDNNPFPTPSGKIEIYSSKWATCNNPKLPPVPTYIETWESRNDPLSAKYPLQLITTHFKRRVHAQFDNVPWLRELEEQAILINSIDAQVRGINKGDKVKVFNARGMVIITAAVTERILPGVVDMPEGAWSEQDENGVDWGGNPNALTRNQPSPIGSYPFNTCLVEVEKL